mmetsp:Transcript_36701/g.77019  ORF Transcript_36701/g.77019 Transcript_36701/m.77019 type:complete len:276 (-) Transcript_36701:459-1286(-)
MLRICIPPLPMISPTSASGTWMVTWAWPSVRAFWSWAIWVEALFPGPTAAAAPIPIPIPAAAEGLDAALATMRSCTMLSMMPLHAAMASAVLAVSVMTRWAVPGGISCSFWICTLHPVRRCMLVMLSPPLPMMKPTTPLGTPIFSSTWVSPTPGPYADRAEEPAVPRIWATGLGVYPPVPLTSAPSGCMLPSCRAFSLSAASLSSNSSRTSFSARSTFSCFPSNNTWSGSSGMPGTTSPPLVELPLPRIEILTFPPLLDTSSRCFEPPGPISSPT